jgi:multidrug resistance efflux pump
MTLVEAHSFWIEGNFEETQLAQARLVSVATRWANARSDACSSLAVAPS